MQHWSTLAHPEGEPWPVGRSGHAATCLSYGSQPQLLVTGGLDKDDKVLNDVWILDVQSGRWRKVRVYGLLSIHMIFVCDLYIT